ncbi:hypothetical protein KKB18_00005, partial [bacterium]|nr:hypothetical protein [bacterium]
ISIPGPHNEFFYYLYSMGILGTTLYIVILLFFIKKSLINLRFFHKINNMYLFHLQTSILTIILTFVIVSNADWRFRRAHDVVWISLFYALTNNISRKPENFTKLPEKHDQNQY